MRGSARTWLIVLASLAMGLALANPAWAQEPPTFTVTIEPARATVGDHLTLTIVGRHPPDVLLEPPAGRSDFAPLALVEARPPESRAVGSGLLETRFVYVLAAFRTGEIRPPPLRIATSDSQRPFVTLRPPSVLIESVLPAEGPARLRGLKPPLRASLGTPTWVWAALAVAGFAGLTVLTMALVRVPVRRPRPSLAVASQAPEGPARRELDAIAEAALLDRHEPKEYYRRIASCLRAYLARRFALPAVAMTAQELEASLEALGVDRWPSRLVVNLLEQCQAVQFAQYAPARERAEADLSSAYEVVALTQPASEAAPAEGAPARS